MKYTSFLFMVSLYACQPNAPHKRLSEKLRIDIRQIEAGDYQTTKTASDVRDKEIYRDSAYSVYNLVASDRTYLVFKDSKTHDEYAAVLAGPCTVNLAGGVYYVTMNAVNGRSDTTIVSRVYSIPDVKAMKRTYRAGFVYTNNNTVELGVPSVSPMENGGLECEKIYNDIQIMDSFVAEDTLYHLVAKAGEVILVKNDTSKIDKICLITNDDLHSNIYLKTYISQNKRITPFLNSKFAGYLCIDTSRIIIMKYSIPENKS